MTGAAVGAATVSKGLLVRIEAKAGRERLDVLAAKLP
ncbi:MAG: hypothetical protein JWN65_3362 [Solirubrobacterales bacterium]|nr:hypothetical protein [Solirubrobacterales bacterium]